MSGALAQAVARLSIVLREENAALVAMDFARAGSLLATKHVAADALASAWRAVDEDAPPLAGLRDLGVLAEENRLLLNRAMRVQRRVLDLVARAARGAARPSRYGASGKAAAEGAAARSLVTRI